MESVAGISTRQASLRHALRLEYLTIGWNVVENVVALAAADGGLDRRDAVARVLS